MARGRPPAADKRAAEADRQTLERVSRGDPAAMEPLYQRFAARAFAICLRILRERHEAEEVLQETFLEVWRRAKEYDPRRGAIEAWVATIARTRAIDHLRTQRTANRVAEAAQPTSVLSTPPTAPDTAAAESQDKVRVEKALKSLPTGQRHALELAYFEGLSHTEIAERTGDPLGTVKTRVRLGMEKLAALIKGRE
jgi:RNA polymerase sigma-70 factor (ECF subfamily)